MLYYVIIYRRCPYRDYIASIIGCLFFFLIRRLGGGVHLGSLGTAATNGPIVPTPGDYDDGEIGGMMIDKGNLSTWRKPAPVPLGQPQNPHALPGHEPGPPRWVASD
jgi:hypothetical protein